MRRLCGWLAGTTNWHLVLAKCGISLIRAKRAVEAVLGHGGATLTLRIVGSRQDLVSELRAAGINAVIGKRPMLDLKLEQMP
jgi:hypothetical protein